MAKSAHFGSQGAPEPPRMLPGSWEKLVPIFLFGGLGIAGLIILVGPTGKTKEAVDNVKPQSKSKLEDKRHMAKEKQAEDKIIAAKPAGKTWTEMTDDDMAALVSRVQVEGLNKEEIGKLASAIRREKQSGEQVLPSDDPAVRWRQTTGTKYENRRQINLKDASGFMNCPQIEVFEDEGKAKGAGQMNDGEWVEILESKGAMARIKRIKDKKECWIEAKVLKEIYTKEDLAKGPQPYKPKDKDLPDDRDKGGKDELD